MAFLDYFRRQTKSSAAIAKDRLQIIVARERAMKNGAVNYLPQLQQELLAVIARYETIDLEQVLVNVDRSGSCEVLEINIVLPEPASSGTVRPATSCRVASPSM